MFFIGIFGIESKEQEIKDINNIICKGCGRISSYKLIKTYNMFHFFFIPLYRWNINYFLISRCCNRVFQVSKDYGHYLETSIVTNLDDSQLHEININYPSKCPNCHATLNTSYVYCPYCGFKIK